MRWFTRREDDLDEEIRSHFRMAIQDRINAGEDPADARHAVLKEFVGIALKMEDTRAVWGWQWLEQTLLDLRFAVRTLGKSPGFAAAAILSLALGIGATTALLSVLHHVALRPLPFADPARLAMAWTIDPRVAGGGISPASFPDWQDWRQQTRKFTGLAAFRNRPGFLTAGDQTVQLELHEVSADFLPLLGVAPAIGRLWTPQEQEAGQVAVISDALWQQAFGGARDVIGRRIVVSQTPYTIVGVMPPGFASPSMGLRAAIRLSPNHSIWTPFVPRPAQRNNRGNRGLRILARVQAATMDAAQTDLATVAGRLAQAYPESNRSLTVQVVPLAESITGAVRPPLVGLAVAGGLFLLIACANVASLVLARDASRRREFATRAALGAGRMRLLRQLLTESLLLAVTGGTAGVSLAAALLTLARQAAAVLEIPRLAESVIDLPVLGAALAISVVTGLLFGLIPAWSVSRVTDARSTADPRSVRLRQVLIGGAAAVTFVLVFSATELLASFQRLMANQSEPAARTYTFQTTLSGTRWARAPLDQQFYATLLDRVRALSQVESMGVTTGLMQIGDPSSTLVTIVGNAPLPPDRQPLAGYTMTGGAFFHLAGVTLREGRVFDGRDRQQTPLVAVVNEAFVRLVSPDQPVMGRKVNLLGVAQEPMEIVGVVSDARRFAPGEQERPRIFYPYTQSASPRFIGMVRMQPGAAPPVNAIRAIVRELDPTLPVFDVQTVDAIIAKATSAPRWGSALVTVFAVMALVLASIGVMGVVGFVASQRSKECGIRLALGAAPRAVRWMIARQGVRPVVAGIAVGVAGTRAAETVIARYLLGTGGGGAGTLLVDVALLAAASGLAAMLPARRATQVDPASALRCD